MRRFSVFLAVLCMLVVLRTAAYSEEIPRSPLLESALSMLEKGNPILEHYGQVTGHPVEARFELGCPYYWGGRSEARLLSVMEAWKSSPGYYIEGRSYLYGYDCNGFISWLLRRHGYQPFGTISGALAMTGADVNIEGSRNAEGQDLSQRLEIGDLLAIRHRGSSYHVAMYIGTLRQYGFSEGTVSPSLVPLLDYPLIIHCTVSSDYYVRYESYIEDAFDTIVYPPDGGVIVSVVAPRDMASDMEINPDNDMSFYCLLEDYRLQVYDPSLDLQTRWLRWPKA